MISALDGDAGGKAADAASGTASDTVGNDGYVPVGDNVAVDGLGGVGGSPAAPVAGGIATWERGNVEIAPWIDDDGDVVGPDSACRSEADGPKDDKIFSVTIWD